MATILITDDDPEIRKLIKQYLESESHKVLTAKDGSSCRKAIKSRSDIDLVILDVMLPDISGMDICRELSPREDIYIIMLTAKDDDIDKILGLELGADDYITKPFNPRELMARVKAILRRKKPLEASFANENETINIVLGKNTEKKDNPVIRIEIGARKVYLDSQEINLTNKEYMLLKYLARNKGIVLSRQTLFQKIWGFDYYGETRTVDVHIKELRKKLSDTSNQYIETIWSTGYRLNYIQTDE